MSLVRAAIILFAACPLAALVSPQRSAQAQNNFLGIVTKLIEEQRALADRRRQQTLAVKRLQLGLKTLGYYNGPVDGDLGAATESSLSEYRSSTGRSQYQDLSIEEIEEIEAKAGEATDAQGTEREEDEESTTAGKLVRAQIPVKLNAGLSDAAAWVVIASRTTAQEALDVAEEYTSHFASTAVVASSNGRFAVVAGWLNRDSGKPLKDALIASNLIPADSFLSSGDKFQAPVWSRNGSSILSRVHLLNYTLLRPTPSLLNDLGDSTAFGSEFGSRVAALPTSDDYLTLRAGDSASAKELRRLPEGTLLKVLRTRGGWHEVRLLNGMTGWVSAKYVTAATDGATEGEEAKPAAASPTSTGSDVAEQERRAEAVKEAMTLLDDLAVYLKLNPETPDIASIAEDITKLQGAVQSNDSGLIDATKQQLQRRMAAIGEFAKFQQTRLQERKTAELKALGEAVSLASKHKQFLRREIAENVTSAGTPALATLLKQYEQILDRPDLAVLTDLNDRVKKVVAEQSLSSKYESSMARLQAEIPGASPTEAGRLETTDANRFLIEGDLSDVVLLYNASGSAPNVIRNIRGDIVFENGAAKTCVLHATKQKIAQSDIEGILSRYSVQNVSLDSSPCTESELWSRISGSRSCSP
jgi:hypothetical protein